MTMTDCSSIQGSTSSSSDVMTLTTAASSWCAIPTNSRIRVLRLVRPHQTRRMLMVTGPESNPSYGFAVRGGKEFGTGFFVSQVERNSEADLKGLHIGDQILRLNGFRVEDAVHKEFIRFVSSQDRINLKVRGVGMLPIKEKESERLSWNVVKMHSISQTPSESSYKTVTTEHSSSCSAIGVGELRCKDISVVLDVAPRTKLGLGICKGPEWKPGIFVQFTKEKSVAREAGLRPGDQILSVNSIDFSDVLFSEAVAVMKSSNKLEMIVRTAAGCDLFPGESSGYNSSASSVTGDQSPCWADAKSKRLTAVHEEPTIAACWNEAMYEEQRQYNDQLQPSREDTHTKEVNKTIIKLSENGTSINNTYVANPSHGSHSSASQKASIGGNVPHEGTLTKTATSKCLYPAVEQQGRSRHLQQSLDIVRNGNNHQFGEQKLKQTNAAAIQRSGSKVTTPLTAAVAAAAASSATPSKTTASPPKAPPPAGYTNSHNKSRSNQNSMQNSNTNEVGAAGSTLSSAITEELKKRKEKQRFGSNTNNADNNNTNNNNNNNICNNYGKSSNNRTEHQQARTTITPTSAVAMQRCQQQQHQHQHQHQHNQHYHNQAVHHHQQQQQHQLPPAMASPTKRAPNVRAVSSNSANCSERNGIVNGNSSSDQHNALMDEFKRAHQRMFKNGFQETEHKERQEALNRTSIMEDDSSHRTSRNFPSEKSSNSDTAETAQQQQQQNIPPPPPQFANSPPKSPGIYGMYFHTLKKVNSTSASTTTTTTTAPTSATTGKATTAGNVRQQSNMNAPKAPDSPTPDYDSMEFRKGRQAQTIDDANSNIHNKSNSNAASNGIGNANTNASRRTMRFSGVTIGEYEQQRKEPGKFEFVGSKNRDNANGSRNVDSLHSELHDTLSRSKLKNGNQVEHKRDCPLRNGYANGHGQHTHGSGNGNGNGNSVEQLTRKIQSVNINQKLAQHSDGTSTIKRQNSSTTANRIGTSTGILKNGNSRHSANSSNGMNGHSAKLVEKTITFGN